MMFSIELYGHYLIRISNRKAGTTAKIGHSRNPVTIWYRFQREGYRSTQPGELTRPEKVQHVAPKHTDLGSEWRFATSFSIGYTLTRARYVPKK